MVQPYFCMTEGKKSCGAAQTQGRDAHIPGTVAMKYSMVPPAALLDQRPLQEAENDALGTFSGSLGNV